MSDAKHTVGPWWPRHGGEPGAVYSSGAGRLVCLVPHEQRDDGEFRPDSCLIAAAPDLLAACEAWDQGFTDGEEFTSEQLLAWLNANRRLARAAIAKARGGK